MIRTHQRIFNSVVGLVGCVVVFFSGWLDSSPDAVIMCRLLIILFIIATLIAIRDLIHDNKANNALFKEVTNVSKP